MASGKPKPKFLLVESDAIMKKSLLDSLNEGGLIEPFSDYLEAIEEVESGFDPEIALLSFDFMRDNISGFDALISLLRQRSGTVQILVLAAPSQLLGIDLTGVHLIEKPFLKSQVRKKVDELLGSPGR